MTTNPPAPQPASAPPEAGEARELATIIRAADRMAKAIDEMVGRGLLNARNPIADARLDYSDPGKYHFERAQAVTAALAQHKAEAEKVKAFLVCGVWDYEGDDHKALVSTREEAERLADLYRGNEFMYDKVVIEEWTVGEVGDRRWEKASMSATPQEGGKET